MDQDLGGALVTVLGDTSLAADDWDPPCSPGQGAPDVGHLFTAPVDGFFAFDTLGSAPLDTVVYLFGGADCSAAVIGCNDDVSLAIAQSRVSLYMQQGDPVVVMVDGFDATQAGAYALDIDAVLGPCTSADLVAPLPSTTVGDTTGAQDKLPPSCAAVQGRDVVFRFVAPAAGFYRIDTFGSSFDTVLHARSGQCSLHEIACNDDTAPGLQSELLIPLMLGEEISIVVDGFGLDEAGAFTLHIEMLEEQRLTRGPARAGQPG
ncbi:MAG: hypothetical protein K0V04_34875 [Deltaproteobacteria bacterium]|nr:hypothetical protein [Deltaproteobacteria bacterium]